MTTAELTRKGTRQLPTHAHLYAGSPSVLMPYERTRRGPDAIVVPASRPASALIRLIDLSARLGTELVVLCSKQANVDQVAERMNRRVGARGVVVRIDDGYELPSVGLQTSLPVFSAVNAGRRSDLSTKRNTGLRLARLLGWEKMVFVDDDITLDPADISRIANQLDRFPIAGMRPLRFPDNSMLCHARRLAGLPQDVFVSGAVLGVHCGRRDLGFFPDVYNEDWFFFGEAAATGRLARPGVARQAEYDPFTATRAGHEEFGDLLAEGLYSLIARSGGDSFEQVVERASTTYWTDFIEVRRESINAVRRRLHRFLDRDSCDERRIHAALAALDVSAERYAGPTAISPVDCAGFLDSWRKDTADWRNGLPEPMRRRSTDRAMEELGITEWLTVR